jgi:nucleotide-binding universal stress UspA family protein
MLCNDEININNFQQLINIKTIIVGVDFSEKSKDFVKVAQSFSKLLGARLVLVNVQSLYPYIESDFGAQAFWDEDYERTKHAVREFYELTKPYDETVEVLFGEAGSEIDNLSKKHPNPLVFIGHSKKNKWEKFWSGSASKTLAGDSDVPVLIY